MIDWLIIGRYRPPCAVCGETDWRAFSTDIDGNPTRLVIGTSWPDGVPVQDYGFAVFAVACGNCRNVRLIAADELSGSDEGKAQPEAEPH